MTSLVKKVKCIKPKGKYLTAGTIYVVIMSTETHYTLMGNDFVLRSVPQKYFEDVRES